MDAHNYFALLIFGIFTVNHVSAFHEVCAGCPIKHGSSSFFMDKLFRALATANDNEGVVKINSVTSQVVSGIKYIVVYESSSGRTCTATWLERDTQAPQGVRIFCETEKTFMNRNGSDKIVGTLLKASQHKRSLSVSDLSPDTVELLRKHLGYLMDDRTNSMYTQEVISMNITRVEKYGHGYRVNAEAVLAFTSCTKYALPRPNEKCELTKNRQKCSVTMTMVQPQGGQKWYKLDQFNCTPLHFPAVSPDPPSGPDPYFTGHHLGAWPQYNVSKHHPRTQPRSTVMSMEELESSVLTLRLASNLEALTPVFEALAPYRDTPQLSPPASPKSLGFNKVNSKPVILYRPAPWISSCLPGSPCWRKTQTQPVPGSPPFNLAASPPDSPR
ncbi:hypothetical protein GE061_007163 [Apolygus lucorum]|uniref:Uncharacterized protein n=1 Tax=Apolygus lucorum TaxID=248454 RepID=A0A8S9WSR0_APOLU|nr:hypothetical protein GE061_007163 [Apolygus lucorum]